MFRKFRNVTNSSLKKQKIHCKSRPSTSESTNYPIQAISPSIAVQPQFRFIREGKGRNILMRCIINCFHWMLIMIKIIPLSQVIEEDRFTGTVPLRNNWLPYYTHEHEQVVPSKNTCATEFTHENVFLKNSFTGTLDSEGSWITRLEFTFRVVGAGVYSF